MGIMQFMDRAAPLALDPAIALLGNEEQGLAIDFTAMRGFIRDRVTGANNWLGDPNAKLTYASPSAKWIWNAFGVLSSGTTLRCDHNPASLDSSVTPLNSLGIGAGAVVNKSIVLASGAFTYPVGEVVRITDAADITKWILGRVVSWTAGTKTLVIAGYAASAPYVSASSWKVIVALGIRVESQRTNLFTESYFRNGISDAPVRSNVTASSFPKLGNNTGLAFAADGLQAYAYKVFALTAGTIYTLSIFVEMDDGLGPPLFGSDAASAASNDFGLNIDGTSNQNLSNVVQNLGGGLYRVSYTRTATASGSNIGVIRAAANRQRAFRISGFQLEVGGFATSYIPTTTAQVTRAADKVTLPVTAFPYSSSVSVLTQDIRPLPGAIAGDTVGIWSGTNANILSGYQQNGSAAVMTARAAGAGVFTQSLGNPPANAFFRTAVRYQVGNAAGIVTSRSLVSPAMAIMPSGLTELVLGGQSLAASPNYWIRNLRYIPRAASDTELQAWAA
ncbi:phage head spike fiber domain-containing protein [Kaistia sp. MMO-174]|uniref:phage head spike fiber domain-containing protein n=1 Tax=Kaistia sp. MMO-174 TaxID=3081256 RepID=UPI003017C50F